MLIIFFSSFSFFLFDFSFVYFFFVGLKNSLENLSITDDGILRGLLLFIFIIIILLIMKAHVSSCMFTRRVFCSLLILFQTNI
jgi:hypothetical protein